MQQTCESDINKEILNQSEMNITDKLNDGKHPKISLNLVKKDKKMSLSGLTIKQRRPKIKLDRSKWIEDEEWRESHASNDYFISNMNRVFSQLTSIIMESKPSVNGYVYYTIIINGKKRQRFSGHKLVMEAFVGPQPKNLVIDHIDRVRHHNKLSNLRYVTKSQNNSNRDKTSSNEAGSYKIQQLDMNGNIIKIWNSQTHAAKTLKLNSSKIGKCIRAELEHYGKSKWQRFIDVIEGEIWKYFTVPTGKVEISNMGRAKTYGLSATFGSNTGTGYMSISVNHKDYTIHRLVCEAFNGPPPSDKHVANHKNKNRKNNKAANLEWVTQKENMEHAYELNNGVTQYDIDGTLIAKHNSIAKASEATGISVQHIKKLCSGYTEKNPLYIFRYFDDTTIDKINNLTKTKKTARVIKMSLDNEELARFNSINEASIKCNISTTSLKRYISKKLPYKGFKWILVK